MIATATVGGLIAYGACLGTGFGIAISLKNAIAKVLKPIYNTIANKLDAAWNQACIQYRKTGKLNIMTILGSIVGFFQHSLTWKQYIAVIGKEPVAA